MSPREDMQLFLTSGSSRGKEEIFFSQRYNILDPVVAKYYNLWNSLILVWRFFTSLLNVEACLNYVCILAPRQKAGGWWAMRWIAGCWEAQSLLPVHPGSKDPLAGWDWEQHVGSSSISPGSFFSSVRGYWEFLAAVSSLAWHDFNSSLPVRM